MQTLIIIYNRILLAAQWIAANIVHQRMALSKIFILGRSLNYAYEFEMGPKQSTETTFGQSFLNKDHKPTIIDILPIRDV